MKRIVSIFLILFIVMAFVMPLYGCKKQNQNIDKEPAMRSMEAILLEDVHYFDDEAIALSDTSGDTASLRSEALRAYNLVNECRDEAGVPDLVWDASLESTSDVRARECEESFSHTRPNGEPWYTVNSSIMGGENLAYGYETASDVLDGWMSSVTHKENILYPDFSKVSVSVYVADDGTYYWSQEFGY